MIGRKELEIIANYRLKEIVSQVKWRFPEERMGVADKCLLRLIVGENLRVFKKYGLNSATYGFRAEVCVDAQNLFRYNANPDFFKHC